MPTTMPPSFSMVSAGHLHGFDPSSDCQRYACTHQAMQVYILATNWNIVRISPILVLPCGVRNRENEVDYQLCNGGWTCALLLPRDTLHSAVLPLSVVFLSVCNVDAVINAARYISATLFNSTPRNMDAISSVSLQPTQLLS